MKPLLPFLLFCLPFLGKAQTAPQQLYERLLESEENLSTIVDSYLSIASSAPNYWSYADSVHQFLAAEAPAKLTLFYLEQMIARAPAGEEKYYWQNSLAYYAIEQENWDMAKSLLSTALAECPKTDPYYSKFYYTWACYLYYSGDYKRAQKALEKSLLAVETAEEKSKIYNLLGAISYQYDALSDAEHYFLEGLALLQADSLLDEESESTFLNNLAQLYKDMGALSKALSFHTQLMAIDEAFYGKGHYYYAMDLDFLAGVQALDGQLKLAKENEEKALAIISASLGKQHSLYFELKANYGAILSSLGEIEAAVANYEELLREEKKVVGPSLEYAISLNNTAVAYFKMGKRKKAMQYMQEALALRKGKMAKNQLGLLQNQYSIARLHYYKEDYELAQNGFWEVIQANAKSENWLAPEELLEADYWHPAFFVQSLEALSQLYRDHEQLENGLDSAAFYLDLALGYNRKIRQELRHEGDKQRTLSLGQRLLNRQFQLQLLRKQPVASLFQLAEEQKAVLFQEEQQLGAWGLQLPDSILDQRAALEEEFMALKQQRSRSLESSEKQALDGQIARQELAITAFEKAVKQQFPGYFAQQLEVEALDIGALQQQLATEELLLAYFWSEEGLYAFALSSEKLQLYELEQEGLVEDCLALQKEMQAFTSVLNDAEGSRERYLKLALLVSEQLLWPILAEQQGQRLTLVLDGPMSYLPFEALLSREVALSTPYDSIPYLIKDWEISYQSSAKLYLDQSRRSLYPYDKVLAFAGSYAEGEPASELRSPLLQNRRSVLGPLPAAQKEVAYLEALFDGQFLYEQEASELNFKRHQQEGYGLLHLALHGILEKRQPFLSSLVFTETADSTEDNFLEAWELGRLQLKSNLLVLSACETGLGEYQSGEGLLSLARAFQFAGSSSIVASLWQVNDQSTAYIMQRFYSYLQEGANKSMALRLAKLDYLNGIGEPSLGHPAYWAAFIQLGDPRPIPLAKKGRWADYWPYALGGLLALSIPMGIFRRWKEKAA
ncbi:hypothetical protein SapgrDRAFT_0487 [Saprospira grandis DSM 2844]|uniref:CHAT domain-containing protein n=1 Tax=Saprospira grandis DSM 2844 TaxID=694433 RepID=J0XTJ3_9BACT|nr:CHAT domain-containing tetratricopeptide repeat protein [Saprospira grandis]EJF52231.1 hypothetical protein SapgrDRAFT_0487 [Saprospira grandis DSM 2844]